MSHYTEITLADMDAFFQTLADKGYPGGFDRAIQSGSMEYAYMLPLAGTPIWVKVFSSVTQAGFARPAGADAIRVCAVIVEGETVKGYAKSERVFRVEGWRKNLLHAIGVMGQSCLARWNKKSVPVLPAAPAPAADVPPVETVACFPVFTTQKARLAWFREQLGTNRALAYQALLAVYASQTAGEQAMGATVDHNGVGFTGVDAEFLSSLAAQLKAKREKYGAQAYLSVKQDAVLFKMMPKYAAQFAASVEQPVEV